jgi:hypothetical protein
LNHLTLPVKNANVTLFITSDHVREKCCWWNATYRTHTCNPVPLSWQASMGSFSPGEDGRESALCDVVPKTSSSHGNPNPSGNGWKSIGTTRDLMAVILHYLRSKATNPSINETWMNDLLWNVLFSLSVLYTTKAFDNSPGRLAAHQFLWWTALLQVHLFSTHSTHRYLDE